MESRPVVIVNPRSGGGLSERQWARLAGPLTQGLGPFDTRFTEAPGHATVLAREAAEQGYGLVVACGGDGTISEVAQGLALSGRAVELGVVPRGTGGDFSRALELPRDAEAAGRRIRTSSPRLLDLGLATFMGHDGDITTRHFINIASFGFSAVVADRANQSSKRLGAKVAFLGATLRTLLDFSPVDVRVSVDDGEFRRTTVRLGAVGNGCFFGGGMKVCPNARMDDGQFELVEISMSTLVIALKIGHIFNGTHLNLAGVQARSARKVRIEPADPSSAATIAIELDGEVPGCLPATFEIVPGKIRLRA